VNAGQRAELVATDQRMSAGDKETDVKLLTVMPTGPSGVSTTTTVTPVANAPNVRLS